MPAADLKGLEYGCSLDPVCQLLHMMTRRHRQGHRAVRLVQVDQYSVYHAPFAQARSLLLEHGFGDVKVLVMERNESDENSQANHRIIEVCVRDLVPALPGDYDGLLDFEDNFEGSTCL